MSDGVAIVRALLTLTIEVVHPLLPFCMCHLELSRPPSPCSLSPFADLSQHHPWGPHRPHLRVPTTAATRTPAPRPRDEKLADGPGTCLAKLQMEMRADPQHGAKDAAGRVFDATDARAAAGVEKGAHEEPSGGQM